MRLIAALFILAFTSGAALAAPDAVHSEIQPAQAASDTAAHETAEPHPAGPPQFAVETFPSQLFWLAISFGALYLLMSGAALPRIEQGIAARSAHIHNLLSDAHRLRDEAESHKNDMNSAADAAHQKAHDMLNKAAVDSQDIASRRNHELEAVLQTKIKASEDRIHNARTSAVQSVREAAQILLPVILNKVANMKLADKEISNLVNHAEAPGTNGNVRGAA